METVVTTIIFIISLSLLIIFISYKFAPAAEEAGNKGIIKAWVLESSRWKLTKTVFSAEPPSYPSVSKLIDKPLEIKTKEQFIEEFDNLASTMVSCFDTFGKGEVDFLPYRIYESEPFCFKCAEIKFNDELIGQSLIRFNDYIKQQSPISSDETYDSLLDKQYKLPEKVPEDGTLYITLMASTKTVWDSYLSNNWLLFSSLDLESKESTAVLNPKIVVGDPNEINSLCSLKKELEIDCSKGCTICPDGCAISSYSMVPLEEDCLKIKNKCSLNCIYKNIPSLGFVCTEQK